MWKMGEELEGMYSIGIDQNQPLKGPLNLLGLLDRESRYPIYKSFYSQLPLNDALVLTRTCKKIRRDYLEKRWDIDRRLTRFVKHPLRFRSELGKHNSLISGSFALQFFAQTLWPEADLDVFVEDGAALASFDAYIQDEEKYELHTTNNCRGYAMNSLVEV